MEHGSVVSACAAPGVHVHAVIGRYAGQMRLLQQCAGRKTDGKGKEEGGSVVGQ